MTEFKDIKIDINEFIFSPLDNILDKIYREKYEKYKLKYNNIKVHLHK